MPTNDLNTIINGTFDQISKSRENHVFTLTSKEIGYVFSISECVVRISGLPNTGFEELLKFPKDLSGIAYNRLDADEIGVILSFYSFAICTKLLIYISLLINHTFKVSIW